MIIAKPERYFLGGGVDRGGQGGCLCWQLRPLRGGFAFPDGWGPPNLDREGEGEVKKGGRQRWKGKEKER